TTLVYSCVLSFGRIGLQDYANMESSCSAGKVIAKAQDIAAQERDHRHFTQASRRPRRTKSAPAVRLSYCEMVSSARNRSLRAEANRARIKHQIVPVATNVSPRVMNAAIFMFDAGSMNCGRNARKNSATLGLSMLVRIPCRNAAALVRLRKLDGKLNCFRRSRIILIPRKIR